MKQLTLKHATDILNWYALEGSHNWGVWGNYPSLPVSASYHSFDTCHLRILFASDVEFGGEVFNCISNKRNVPGNKVKNVMTLSELKAICEQGGVSFVNEYMTTDKANELKEKRIADAKKVVADFEVMATYEWQEVRVREQVMNALNNISVNKVHGNSIPKSIEDYTLTIANYCEKQEASITVDLQLTSTNSKKTCGHYKAINPDNNRVEEIIRVFTNERVASCKSNLDYHRQTLSELV